MEPPNIGDGADALGAAHATGSARQHPALRDLPEGAQRHRVADLARPARRPGLPAGLAGEAGAGQDRAAADHRRRGGHAGRGGRRRNPAHPGPEIVATSAAGPIYVLDAAGHSVYGSTAGRRHPAVLGGGHQPQDTDTFGANRNSNDLVASLIGFGGPSSATWPAAPARRSWRRPRGSPDCSTCSRPTCSSRTTTRCRAGTGPPACRCPGSPQASPDLAFFAAPAWPTSTATASARPSSATASTPCRRVNADGHATRRMAQAHRRLGGRHPGRRRLGRRRSSRRRHRPARRHPARVGAPGAAVAGNGIAGAGVAWAQWGCDSYHSGSLRRHRIGRPTGGAAVDHHHDRGRHHDFTVDDGRGRRRGRRVDRGTSGGTRCR